MSYLSKPKVIVYLVAIFIAGTVTGGVWGYASRKEKAFVAPQPEDLATKISRRVRSDLQLSDDQMKQIAPILHQTASEVCAANRDCGRRVREIFAASRKRMVPFLTDEQISLVEALQKKDDEFFKSNDRSREKRPTE